MLDANGAVRTVYGIAASVTPRRDAEITNVLSQACGKNFCLAKTETSVVSSSGNVDAPAGPALFAFVGDTAFIWFRRNRGNSRNGKMKSLTPIDSTIDGEVLSIRSSAGSVEFAVRRESGVWIVKPDGSVMDSLPHSSGPVMLIPGGVVYATRERNRHPRCANPSRSSNRFYTNGSRLSTSARGRH